MSQDKKRNRWHWLKRLLLGLIILILLLLAAGLIYQTTASTLAAQANPPPGELVDAGGHQLHIYCLGQGSPTVILETGLGDNSTVWALVQPEVAKQTRVCAYDRAGFGWSDDGPQPRDSASIVKELKTLLTNAGITPPYVLAGHSIAGLHNQLYAHTYPEDVVGMVLIDASHEEWSEQRPPELDQVEQYEMRMLNLCRFIAPLGIGRLLGVFNYSGLPENIQPAADMVRNQNRLCRSTILEKEAVAASEDQLSGLGSLGDMPLMVLTEGKSPNPEELPPGQNIELMAKMLVVWGELQEKLAARSSNSSHIIAKQSGHYIHLEQPELVIAAIKEVLNEVRAPGQGLDAFTASP